MVNGDWKRGRRNRLKRELRADQRDDSRGQAVGGSDGNVHASPAGPLDQVLGLERAGTGLVDLDLQGGMADAEAGL